MNEKLRKFYYRAVILVAAAVFLYMTYVRFWENDVFEDSSTDPGYVSSSYLQSDEHENLSYDHYLPDGYTLAAEGFEQIYFYPGTYRLSIDAQTSSEHAFYQVIDLWTNTVLAEGGYDPGEDNHWIWFATEETYQYVVVRSYVLTEELAAEEVETGADILTISAYSMYSDSTVVTDSKWEILLLLALALLIGGGAHRIIHKGRPALFTLSVMSAVVSLPFAADFLPYGYDTQFHLARIFSLGQSISDGQIPQRINTTITNGGITPVLYPELMLYGAGLMVAGGASVMLAYQSTCVLITFLTSFVSYYAARQVCDSHSALLFAFIYLINPFRLNEIILLGAIGAAFALAFLPLIVVGMWKILSEDSRGAHRRGALDLVIGYTGLISSHIVTCLIAALLCVIIVVCIFLVHPLRFVRNGRRILWMVLAAGLVLALNIWFIYPLLHYLGIETEISVESYQRLQITEPYVWQVFMNVLGRFDDNGSSHSAGNEMSFSVGIAALVGVILFAGFLLHDQMVSRCGLATTSGTGSEGTENAERSPEDARLLLPEERKLGIFCGTMAAVFLYMGSSLFPWDWVLESNELLEQTVGGIQYSWRLLAIVALMLSAVLVIVIRALNRRGTIHMAVLSGGLVLMCVLTATEVCSWYYTSNVGEMDGKFDASYRLYRDYYLAAADDAVIYEWYESGEGPLVLSAEKNAETGEISLSSESVSGFEITEYHRNGAGYRFTFVNQSGEDVEVTIPVLWYGLHTAYLTIEGDEIVEDLTPVMNEATQFTDILISADTAEGTVVLTYVEPVDYRIADIISLSTLVVLVLLHSASRKHHLVQ